jgi:membrane protease YdiL (CAAX protease family)
MAMGQEPDQADHGRSPVRAAATSWRESKWLILADVTAVGLIFLADQYHWIKFSKTPYFFVIGCISLWLRKKRWRDVGFRLFRSWRATLGYGVAAGISMELFQLLVSQPLLVLLTGQQPDLEQFRPLIGDAKLLLAAGVAVWVLAAFGEEMVFRGYLMNRVADLGNRTRLAWIVSLVVVNALFGLCHGGQGITGIIDEGFMGLLLGLIYLGCGRNLAVPIVAHGVQDSVDIVLIFLGKYPGM